MTPEEHRAFWRNVQFTVDKDVVRTDRSHNFFTLEMVPKESVKNSLIPSYGSIVEKGFLGSKKY